MKKKTLLFTVATLLCVALVSCDRNDDIVPDPDPETEQEQEQEQEHPYEVSISGEGLDNVKVTRICEGLNPYGWYEAFVEADCDWVTVVNGPEESLQKDIPLITVLPNNTGETRSVEISIKSTPASNVDHNDTHLLVQKPL